jgi:hypothetical protein
MFSLSLLLEEGVPELRGTVRRLGCRDLCIIKSRSLIAQAPPFSVSIMAHLKKFADKLAASFKPKLMPLIGVTHTAFNCEA